MQADQESAVYDREVRLLIVDDHANYRDSASVLFEGAGFNMVDRRVQARRL
jgi:FixJ family two-component response regulator